jgi:hypothetical protein
MDTCSVSKQLIKPLFNSSGVVLNIRHYLSTNVKPSGFKNPRFIESQPQSRKGFQICRGMRKITKKNSGRSLTYWQQRYSFVCKAGNIGMSFFLDFPSR